MSTFNLRLGAMAAAVACAGALSACGGSDGGSETAAPPSASANEVPSSALVSAAAFTEYAKSLGNSDSASPVEVNNFGNAPTADTGDGNAI